MSPSRRALVVGGGIAGMAAARALLRSGASVALIEAEARLGGHCHRVELPERLRGEPLAVDGGVSDVNRATFTGVTALLEELDVDVAPIGVDVCVADERGATLWHRRAGRLQGGGPGLALEQERLRRELVEVLEQPARFAGWTAGRYLDHRRHGEELVRLAFAPRAHGCFAMPAAPARELPIQPLAAFWRAHGIIGARPADRVHVRGGMFRYASAFARRFVAAGGELVLGRRALAARRHLRGVDVWLDGGRRLRADALVLAGAPAAALAVLADATPSERAALSAFPFQRARVVVHRDRALLPAARTTWGAFNYLARERAAAPTVTFHVNQLAGLPDGAPDTFVTINPFRPPAHVLSERWILHPVGDGHTGARSAALGAARGPRVAFAGSYLVEPWIHEAALASGARAAARVLPRQSLPLAA